MNTLVKNMVDLLFQDVEENEETLALHEELMNNCQEHFQDLTSGGMSEDDAAQAVMDSLAGMQEVLDQYPRKAEQPEPEAAAPEAEAPEAKEEPAEEKAADGNTMTVPAQGLTRIRVDAGAHDVRILPGGGSQAVISCAELSQFQTEVQDGILNVRVVRVTDEVCRAAEETLESGKRVLDMSIGELLGKVKSLVENTARSVVEKINSGFDVGSVLFHECAPLEIRVPEGLKANLEITTSSGDVTVERSGAAEAVIHSASGDVAWTGGSEAMDRLVVSTAGGDLKVTEAWIRSAELSVISGDASARGDFGDVFIKSVSGDASFDGSAVNLHGKSVSGDVEAAVRRMPEGTIRAESISGDVEVILPADTSVTAGLASTSGETWSDFEDAGAEAKVKLNAHTVSGDVRVLKC